MYDLCVKYSEHCLQELKNKEKSSWVIPKVVAVTHGSSRLPELFIPKFKSQFKQGFTKVVLSRAGCLRVRVVARRASTVFTLLYYANGESDGVINNNYCFTKTVEY